MFVQQNLRIANSTDIDIPQEPATSWQRRNTQERGTHKQTPPVGSEQTDVGFRNHLQALDTPVRGNHSSCCSFLSLPTHTRVGIRKERMVVLNHPRWSGLRSC